MKKNVVILSLILTCVASEVMAMSELTQIQKGELKKLNEILQTQTQQSHINKKDEDENESISSLFNRLIPHKDLHSLIFYLARGWQDKTENAMTFYNSQKIVELPNSHIATGQIDDAIQIWDTRKKNLIKTLDMKCGYLMEYVKASNIIVSNPKDQVVIYSLDNNTYKTLPGTGSCFYLHIMQNKYVATETEGTFKVWDLAHDLQCIATIGKLSPPSDFYYTKKEQYITHFNHSQKIKAVSNGNFVLYNQWMLKIVNPHKSDNTQPIMVHDCSFHDHFKIDDKLFLRIDCTDKTCRFGWYDLTTKEPVFFQGKFIGMLPDKRFFLLANEKLYLWDTNIEGTDNQFSFPIEHSYSFNHFIEYDYDVHTHTLIISGPLIPKEDWEQVPHDKTCYLKYVWDLSKEKPVLITTTPIPTKKFEYAFTLAGDENIAILKYPAHYVDNTKNELEIINPKNLQVIAQIALPTHLHSDCKLKATQNSALYVIDYRNTIILEPTKPCELETVYVNVKKKEQTDNAKIAAAIKWLKQHPNKQPWLTQTKTYQRLCKASPTV